jgi:hypothetical protein
LAEPFRFTTGRWYNKPRDDGGYAKAPAYREGFTYDDFGYGTDTPAGFTPSDWNGVPDEALVQHSLICSPSACFLAIDVDYPEHLPGSATGEHVSWADAISVRGTRFHAGLDMRGVSEQDWPAQGRTAWGDVKAAGFIPVPGSVHYTGELYAPSASWHLKILTATPELLAALRQDRGDHALARLNDARSRLGAGTGTALPDGTYLYASGYAGGSWDQLPDGSLTHDDELKDLAWDMGTEYGREEGEVRYQWQRLAGAVSSPWTEKDFTRHWKKVPARRAEILEADDATRLREDFGLAVLPTLLEAEQARQQEVFTERTTAPAGFGPPTPPQPDGIYEYDYDGISWFHYYLGAEVFDAGRPTDAGNAEAVLRRAWRVLRHDEEADTWFKRTAGRWVQDADAAKEAVTALGFLLPAERSAEPLKDPRYEHLDPEADAGLIAALKRHAKNYERFSTSAVVNSIAAMMKNIARARSEPWMTVRDSAVDADPEILWAGGVPWDLKQSGRFPVRSARTDRNEPHAHSAACVPDAAVGTPMWNDLLDAVWPPRPYTDAEGRPQLDRSLQQWAVLMLSAGVTGYPKKVVPLLRGGTDRGKSTMIDAIADVLGSYFRPLNEKILEAGASTHDTVLMELKGTRLTFLDEGIQRGKVATARLKRLVGGSSITANRMRQDPVTFRPTHTLAITLNPEEEFSFDDPAVDSRLRLLPCDGNPVQVVSVAQKFDYFHSPKWIEERPGVLARLMSAAARVLNDVHALDKDHAPAAVTMAEQDAKNREDEVLRWFLEATEECSDGYPSRELYVHFKNWTEEVKTDRSPVPTETRWGRRMNELVPEDHPDQKPLTTPKNSKLRRRRPAGPGSGGFGGSGNQLSAFWSQGASGTIRPVVIPRTTVVDSVDNSRYDASNPPESANPPANPPESLTSSFANSSVGSVGSVSHHQETPNKTSTTRALHTNGTGETHRGTEPTGEPADPVVPDKTLPAETGENGKTAENADSPPKARIPRTKLTDEERANRLAERKAKLAQARVDARAAKVAELGGALVQLPAIVLRDQRIIEVDAATAAKFLAPVLDEISVDVEHTGYPRMHKDYRLRLVQAGTEHFGVVLDPSDPAQAEVIRGVLRDAKILHAHSALADLIPLEAAGLCDATVWDRMRDTVIAAKLSDPRLCDSDEVGLKQLARKLLGDEYALSWRADELRKEIFAAGGWIGDCEVTTPVERSGWANIPVCEAFVRYAASDVLDVAAVARTLCVQ